MKTENMKTFIEWKNAGRMVRVGQKGTRCDDGIVRFSEDQTQSREPLGNLYDDLGHECTDYDGDGI